MNKASNSVRIGKSPAPRPTRVLFVTVTSVGTLCLFAAILSALVLKQGQLPMVGVERIVSVENKLQRAQHPVSGTSRRVSLDEGEVNAWLHDRLDRDADSGRRGVVRIRDLRVHLIEDRVRAYIVLGHGLTEITINLEGKLCSRDGEVQFSPTTGAVGSMPIPQAALIGAIQGVTKKLEEQPRLRLPWDISDLRVDDGHVVLQYR